MRQRGRIDSNQNEIVECFRKLGASVAITSQLGDGFVDIVVGAHGKTCLVEIKDGSKPPSARKLTDEEQNFHNNWKGSIAVVENELDAYELMRLLSV